MVDFTDQADEDDELAWNCFSFVHLDEMDGDTLLDELHVDTYYEMPDLFDLEDDEDETGNQIVEGHLSDFFLRKDL